MKIAAFDFCKTIVNINTLNKFVEYVIEEDENLFTKKIKKLILKNKKVFNRLFLTKSRTIEIALLKGYYKNFLEIKGKEFFYNQIVNSINKKVVDYLLDFKEKKFVIVVLSAALDVYLLNIKDILPVDYVICSRLKYKNNMCLGVVDGIDCYGYNKIIKMSLELPFFNEICWEDSFYFTDDYFTERKVLEKFGNKFVVISRFEDVPNLSSFNIIKI